MRLASVFTFSTFQFPNIIQLPRKQSKRLCLHEKYYLVIDVCFGLLFNGLKVSMKDLTIDIASIK